MAETAPVSYSILQRIVHWLSVLLILFNLIVESAMEKVVDMTRDGQTPSPDQISSANLHLYVGVSVLVLTIVRLILRFVQGVPLPPKEEPAIFQLASKAGHAAIILLLIGLPVSGLLAYFQGIQIAGFLHGGPLKALLWVLIVVHIAAALVHKFYWKTDVLDRMTKGVKRA